jgi:hypothetical protein
MKKANAIEFCELKARFLSYAPSVEKISRSMEKEKEKIVTL